MYRVSLGGSSNFFGKKMSIYTNKTKTSATSLDLLLRAKLEMTIDGLSRCENQLVAENINFESQ